MPTPVDIWPPYTRREAEELAYLTPSREEELREEFGDPADRDEDADIE